MSNLMIQLRACMSVTVYSLIYRAAQYNDVALKFTEKQLDEHVF